MNIKHLGDWMKILFMLGVLCSLLLQPITHVLAQEYPTKPVKLVLPFPTGGTFFVGQLLAEGLSESLGQPVVIENKPGAGGLVAMEYAAKAAPDGYTLFVTSPTLTITPIIKKNLKFDPLKDLMPISMVAAIPNVMVVNPQVNANTFNEFIQLARNAPGKLTYGTGGPGASNNFATEQFLSIAKIKVLPIPYQSASHAVTNLVGGQIDMVIGGLPTSAPLVVGKQLKALALFTTHRSPLLPDVPTVVELGLPELVTDTWYGLLAPKGTNPQIIERLNREITKIMKTNETKVRLEKQGVTPLWSSTAEFADFIKNDYEKWSKLASTNNMKFN
jgi:tripartite-type tricarboxylate transporter receptor subunit TctC